MRHAGFPDEFAERHIDGRETRLKGNWLSIKILGRSFAACGDEASMSKADVLNAKAEEAERRAHDCPLLRASYLEVAAVWRSMARQARLIASIAVR